MAKYQKVFLRVVGMVGDTTVDADKLPDRLTAEGQVLLKPNTSDDYAENTYGPDGIAELELPNQINATIKNGWLTYNDDPFVWLRVSEEGWNWNISFSNLRLAGVAKKLKSWNFELTAATEDQITRGHLDPTNPSYYPGVNLAPLIEFINASTGNKVSKGDQGWGIMSIALVGDDGFQFVTNNPDPIDKFLPVMKIPAFTNLRDSVMNAASIATLAAELADSSKNLAATSATAASGSAANALTYRNAAEGFKNTATSQAGIATTKASEAAASAVAAGQAVLGQIPNGSLRHEKFAARDLSNLMPTGDLELDILSDLEAAPTFTYTYDTGVKWEGSRSLKITSLNGEARGKGIPTSPGEAFLFSVMQRVPTVLTGPGGLRIRYKNTAGAWNDVAATKSSKAEASQITPVDTWQKGYFMAIMPADAVSVQWRIALGLTGANPGLFYDDIDFRRIPEVLVPASIKTADIDFGQVNSGHIVDGTIVNADINASAGIVGSKLASGSIGSTQITDGGIATVDLADLAVTLAKLAPLSVDAGKIQDGAVTLAKHAANSVDSSKIVDAAILDADINFAANIQGSKLLDNSLPNAKLTDLTITNAKIAAAAAIAISKLETGWVKAFRNGVATNTPIWIGTEAEYTALASKDANTLYFRS